MQLHHAAFRALVFTAALVSTTSTAFAGLDYLSQWGSNGGRAARAFDLALAGGGGERPTMVHLLRGISCYLAGRYGDARESLERAMADRELTDQASYWLDRVQRATTAAGRAATPLP